jgi:ribosome-associated protein
MAAPEKDEIRITREVVIPYSELEFRFSRSGGPGGQHVNRSATRVELLFDVANSPSLTDETRERIEEELAGFISSEGVLRLASDESRSQHRNRRAAVKRFRALMKQALRPRKERRPTRPSKAAQERRLRQKRKHSEKKQRRRQTPTDY